MVENIINSPSYIQFVHNNLFAVLDSAEATEPELSFMNSLIPSTISAPHDIVLSQARDPFVEAYDDSIQRLRGGRPLKPTQRLKEMEWFIITGKGRRSRGKILVTSFTKMFC